MQVKYVFSKKSKNQLLAVALQNYAKNSFKKHYKKLSYLFFEESFTKCFRQSLSKR